MTTVNEYIANISEPHKLEYQRIKRIVDEVVPDTEVVMSYGIPTFKYKGKYLIYFGAFKNHMSLFPASDSMIEALGDKVGKFRASKGTLRFTIKNPIPDAVVKEIVQFQLGNSTKKY